MANQTFRAIVNWRMTTYRWIPSHILHVVPLCLLYPFYHAPLGHCQPQAVESMLASLLSSLHGPLQRGDKHWWIGSSAFALCFPIVLRRLMNGQIGPTYYSALFFLSAQIIFFNVIEYSDTLIPLSPIVSPIFTFCTAVEKKNRFQTFMLFLKAQSASFAGTMKAFWKHNILSKDANLRRN